MTEIQKTYPPHTLLAKAEKAASVMKLLSHPQRLCILRHIAFGPCSVSELVEMCKLSQPQVSQFLTTLRQAGMITPCKEGRFVIYKISDERVLKVIKLITELYCAD